VQFRRRSILFIGNWVYQHTDTVLTSRGFMEAIVGAIRRSSNRLAFSLQRVTLGTTRPFMVDSAYTHWPSLSGLVAFARVFLTTFFTHAKKGYNFYFRYKICYHRPSPWTRFSVSQRKTCRFKTWCQSDKSNIENSSDHFCEDNVQTERTGCPYKPRSRDPILTGRLIIRRPVSCYIAVFVSLIFHSVYQQFIICNVQP